MPQGIIFCPCLAPKCEQRYPSSTFGVSLMWSVIVAFRPAPPSRYRYNLSRAWVGIVGKYKVTKIVCLPQQTAIVSEFETTMVVANGLTLSGLVKPKSFKYERFFLTQIWRPLTFRDFYFLNITNKTNKLNIVLI